MPAVTTYAPDTQWTYRNLRHQAAVRTSSLRLVWEVDWSAMSDEYDPAEIDAHALFREWRRRYAKNDILAISWFVDGGEEGTFEAAPFETTPASPIREDFLSFFTWPTHARTRERINWLRLPVADGQWNDERTTKGGFIQEALGWKPSPLIASVDITQLAAAAGI